MLSALINHLWQSTLFAGGVGILTLMLHRNSASVRFGLWLSASVKFLVPFALLEALGSRIPRQPPHLNAVATGAQTPAAVIDRVVASGPAMRHLISTASAAAASGHPLPNALGIVWACGVLVIAFYWMVGWGRIRRALVASRQTSIEFPIPVRTSKIMQEPAVAGIVRPVLLVPEGIENWLSTQQLQAVLAHERCHLRRRDNLTAALHMVVQALFWFHPLTWWLGTRLVNERERACDEEVLASGNKAKAYAEGIVRICQHYLQSPLRCAAGVGGGNLTRRIEFILNRPRLVRLSALQTMLLGGIATAVVAEPIVSGHLTAPFSHRQVTHSEVFRNHKTVIPTNTDHKAGKDLLIFAANGNVTAVRSVLPKAVAVDFQDSNVSGISARTQAAELRRKPDVQKRMENGTPSAHRGNEIASGNWVTRPPPVPDTSSAIFRNYVAVIPAETPPSDGLDLINAAGNGDLPQVRSLLDKGVDIEYTDGAVTALTQAAQHGGAECEAVVRLLLANGAQVEHRRSNGETALTLAARKGDVSIVEMLLDAGAQVDDHWGSGYTSLMLASAGGHQEVVQLLLSRGADVNRETLGGETALMMAAQGGQDRVVRLLLDLGADIRRRLHDGETALDLAVQGRQVDVVETLLQRGARAKP